jgi:hypothetical protein
MHKFLAVKLIAVALMIYIYGCGDKKDDKTNDNNKTTDLVQKDSVTGKEQVTLKYKVKKGDIFRYKMVAKTSNMEQSPSTENKEVTQNNEINYFYSKEVTEVDDGGVINFKVNFDSITISSKMDEQSIQYNSNVNDSIKQNPAFLQYNAVVNNPFYIRVSQFGEINDVYGLEKVYESLFKSLGDTLKEADKQSIKEQFGEESIKEILQQEYQIAPKTPIAVDSAWTKSYTTTLLFFEVVNNAKYTIKGIENKDGQSIAKIEAMLNVEFKNKEVTEKGMKVAITNSETGGSGNISVNLNRGCVSSKETTTNLKLVLKLSAQGQSANSTQGVVTNLNVQLLN